MDTESRIKGAVPTIRWHEVITDDANRNVRFQPEWVQQLGMLPHTGVFGENASFEDINALLARVSKFTSRVDAYAGEERDLTMIFVLEYTLLTVRLRRRASRVDAFQLFADPSLADVETGGNVVRTMHAWKESYEGVVDPTERRLERRGQPQRWSASLQLTLDVAIALGLASTTFPHEPVDIIHTLDAQLNGFVPMTLMRSITFLQAIERAERDTADWTHRATARVEVVIEEIKFAHEIAQRARSGMPIVRNNEEVRHQLAARQNMAFETVAALAETWFGVTVPRLRVEAFDEWAPTLLPSLPAPDDGYPSMLEIDDSQNHRSLLEVLRLVRRVAQAFAPALPRSVYPFVLVMASLVDDAQPPAETKEGLLIVRETSLSFTQVGQFNGELQARHIVLETDASGDEIILLRQWPETNAFGEPPGAYVHLVSLPTDPNVIGQDAQLRRFMASVGEVTPQEMRRGEVLAPVFDSSMDALLHNTRQAYIDMVSLLVFTRDFAEARPSEQPALARIYRDFAPLLREYIRDLLPTVYASNVLERITGSSSSTNSSDESQTSLFTSARRLMHRSAYKRIDLVKAFDLSRARRTHQLANKRKQNEGTTTDDDDDDDDDNNDNDDIEQTQIDADDQFDETEDTQLRKRVRLALETSCDKNVEEIDDDNKTVEERSGNRNRCATDESIQTLKNEREAERRLVNLDDDEVENIVASNATPLPDAEFPSAHIVRSVGLHELTVRVIVDYVAAGSAIDLPSLQLVSRVFSRQAIDLHPLVYAELWRSKYPMLAPMLSSYEKNEESPSLLMPRPKVVADLLTRLYTRYEELRSTIGRLNWKLIDVERIICGDMYALYGDDINSIDYAETARDYRSAIVYNVAVRTRLTELIRRVEGRALFDDNTALPSERRRAKAFVNRQWTSLMAIVDNIAHHPRVRQALLAPPLQADAVEELRTVDAEAIDALLRRGKSAPDAIYLEVTHERNGRLREIDKPLDAHGVHAAGRYFLARRNDMQPHINFNNVRDEVKHTRFSTRDHAWLLFSRERMPSIDVRHLLHNDYVRLYSPDESYDADLPHTQRDMRAELITIDDGARVVASTTWRSLTDAKHRRVPKTSVQMRQALLEAEIDGQTNVWQELEFKEEFVAVAIDVALLTGLTRLQARMALLRRPLGTPDMLEYALQNTEIDARTMVNGMLATGEIEPNEFDEALETTMRNLQAQMRRKDEYELIERKLHLEWIVSRVSQKRFESTSVTARLLAQLDETFVEAFLTEDEYINVRISALASASSASTSGSSSSIPPAGPTRVFRRCEYRFLRMMYTLLTVGLLRNKELTQLRAINMIAVMRPSALRSRLIADVNRFAESFGNSIDHNFASLLSNAQTKQQLLEELRQVGISLEE